MSSEPDRRIAQIRLSAQDAHVLDMAVSAAEYQAVEDDEGVFTVDFGGEST